MWKLSFLSLCILLFPQKGWSDFLIETRDPATAIFYDLELATYFDSLLHEKLPVTYNHLLSTGYFTTPSARMSCSGQIGTGIASVPPYTHVNVFVQPFSRLELTGNYRIFRDVEDPGLSKHGFGDFADRGANFKVALFTPEDSDNILPGLAFGIEDFMGTKKFTNYFVIATKIFIDYGLETSFGWGVGRYTKRGFFGGMSWFPFYRCPHRFFSGISLAAEYDPTDYENPKREPHPDGRVCRSHFNIGLKYQLCDCLFFSASWIRGDAFATSGALVYNFADFEGFLPKLNDPLPYFSPTNHTLREEPVLIEQLAFAFENQGLLIKQAWVENTQHLYLKVINQRYRKECQVKYRIDRLLAALIPENIEEVVVIIESRGLVCQQYLYPRFLLYRWQCKKIGSFEFDLLTSRKEAQKVPHSARSIYHLPLELWKARLSPRFETFFGNAKGKFKYDLGAKVELEGFLPANFYYELQFSYTLFSTLKGLSDVDYYNPSQLPIVLTDYVRYRQKGQFSTDRVFLQKSWNLGKGFFARSALGYFQVNYAGFAGEFLYYPANYSFGVGIEGAVLKKRTFNGLGFQDKLKKYEGYKPTYIPYTTLQQYFLNFYFDFPEISVASNLSFGRFLDKDSGLRFELARYFANGIRLSGWVTYTNAKDKVHGENYYNRGIAIEFPLDLFYKCSSRRVFNYGMAAWLRDAGAFTSTGRSLFEIINRERR